MNTDHTEYLASAATLLGMLALVAGAIGLGAALMGPVLGSPAAAVWGGLALLVLPPVGGALLWLAERL